MRHYVQTHPSHCPGPSVVGLRRGTLKDAHWEEERKLFQEDLRLLLEDLKGKLELMREKY